MSVTDRWLTNWKNSGYIKRDGTPVKNQAHLEELDRLLSMIDAKFVLSNYKTRYDNDVINALRANANLVEDIGKYFRLLFITGTCLDCEKHIFSAQAVVESFADSENIIYTYGAIQETNNNGKKFVLAGYGVHWPAKSGSDTCGRFAQFPVTEFRAQMQAIIEGLKLVCLCV
jgi:ribonuclease HI